MKKIEDGIKEVEQIIEDINVLIAQVKQIKKDYKKRFIENYNLETEAEATQSFKELSYDIARITNETKALLYRYRLDDDIEFERKVNNAVDLIDSFYKTSVESIIDLDQVRNTNILGKFLNDKNVQDMNLSEHLAMLLEGDRFNNTYIKNVYSECKNNIPTSTKINFIKKLNDPNLAYEALSDDTLNMPNRLELIGLTKDMALAKRTYNSKEYKDAIDSGACSMFGKSAEFVVTLLGNNPARIFMFIKNHNQNEFEYLNYKLKEILKNNNPGLYKFLCTKDELFKYKLDHGTKRTFKSSNKGNPMLLCAEPTDKNVKKVALTQNIADIQNYYIKNAELLGAKQKTQLLIAMQKANPQFAKEFLESRFNAGEYFFNIGALISASGIEVRNPTMTFDGTILEFPIEKLEKLKDVKYIYFSSDFENISVHELIEMRKNYDELFGDIPKADKNDVKSQYDVYKQVFQRIKYNVKYNDDASKDKNSNERLLSGRRNSFYSSLIRKSTLCGGLSRLLVLALNDKSVECVNVDGFIRPERRNKKILKGYKNYKKIQEKVDLDKYAIEDFIEDRSKTRLFYPKYDVSLAGPHGWNQVKIGDHFFNCDITNYDNPDTALLSDQEFNSKWIKYYRRKSEIEHDCPISIKEAYPELLPIEDSPITLANIRDNIRDRNIASS